MDLTTALKTITPYYSTSESEKVCPKHNIRMHEININGKTTLTCDKCTKEKIDAEDLEIAFRATKELVMGKTYWVLERYSLIGDSTLENASFGNYEANEKETIENKRLATEAFQRLKNGEHINLWFAGNPGAGKSHLAMSILRNLNEIGRKRMELSFDKGEYSGGYKCLFINFDRMLRLIRDSFNNPDSRYTESYFVDMLSSADYLVIDDLGAESGAIDGTKQASDFVHRVLYAVSDARQDKSTIITTNLSGPKLMRMYDQKVLSRLFKNMQQIVFKETKDHRAAALKF